MSDNIEKYISRKVYKGTSSKITQKFVDIGLEKLRACINCGTCTFIITIVKTIVNSLLYLQLLRFLLSSFSCGKSGYEFSNLFFINNQFILDETHKKNQKKHKKHHGRIRFSQKY